MAVAWKGFIEDNQRYLISVPDRPVRIERVNFRAGVYMLEQLGWWEPETPMDNQLMDLLQEFVQNLMPHRVPNNRRLCFAALVQLVEEFDWPDDIITMDPQIETLLRDFIWSIVPKL